MPEDARSSTQQDKLIATIRFAIIAVLVGVGIYFLGPTLGQMWHAFQQAGATDPKPQSGPVVNAESKKAPVVQRTLTEFTLGTGVDGGSANLHINLQNKNRVALTDVELRLVLFHEDNAEVVVERSWANWDASETKKIGLSTNSMIRGCNLSGKGMAGKEGVLLHGRFTFDADKLSFTKFQVRTWQAKFASYHNVYIMNKTGGSLTDVNLTLHVKYESSKTHEVTRSWSQWDAGQELTIDVPSHSRIQRIFWKGMASANGSLKSIGFETVVK